MCLSGPPGHCNRAIALILLNAASSASCGQTCQAAHEHCTQTGAGDIPDRATVQAGTPAWRARTRRPKPFAALFSWRRNSAGAVRSCVSSTEPSAGRCARSTEATEARSAEATSEGVSDRQLCTPAHTPLGRPHHSDEQASVPTRRQDQLSPTGQSHGHVSQGGLSQHSPCHDESLLRVELSQGSGRRQAHVAIADSPSGQRDRGAAAKDANRRSEPLFRRPSGSRRGETGGA